MNEAPPFLKKNETENNFKQKMTEYLRTFLQWVYSNVISIT